MRAHAFCRQHATVERHHGIGQTWRMRAALDPSGAGEFVAVFELNAAAEAIGDVGLIVAKHIHAKCAVLKDGGGGAALVMDADQNGRTASVGGYRRHGGYGDAGPSRRAIGRDDVDAKGGATHAIDELRADIRLGLTNAEGWHETLLSRLVRREDVAIPRRPGPAQTIGSRRGRPRAPA